jgi:hypothetical protein
MYKKLILLVFMAIGLSAFSQTDLEMLIRDLEQQEVTAVLNQDTETLKKIWGRNVLVNNPFNEVITARDQIFGFMKSDRIQYSRFVRRVEHIDVRDEMVISMGHEEIVHAITEANIKRRYTNIWMLDEGEWKIVIRHANIICTER